MAVCKSRKFAILLLLLAIAYFVAKDTITVEVAVDFSPATVPPSPTRPTDPTSNSTARGATQGPSDDKPFEKRDRRRDETEQSQTPNVTTPAPEPPTDVQHFFPAKPHATPQPTTASPPRLIARYTFNLTFLAGLIAADRVDGFIEVVCASGTHGCSTHCDSSCVVHVHKYGECVNRVWLAYPRSWSSEAGGDGTSLNATAAPSFSGNGAASSAEIGLRSAEKSATPQGRVVTYNSFAYTDCVKSHDRSRSYAAISLYKKPSCEGAPDAARVVSASDGTRDIGFIERRLKLDTCAPMAKLVSAPPPRARPSHKRAPSDAQDPATPQETESPLEKFDYTTHLHALQGHKLKAGGTNSTKDSSHEHGQTKRKDEDQVHVRVMCSVVNDDDRRRKGHQ